MAAGRQGNAAVEYIACKRNHRIAAHRIIALARRQIAALVDGIGAVERIVKAAPARIGGIQGIAGIVDRHHQLRPRLLGQFAIDIFRGDFKIQRRVDQIFLLVQKSFISRQIGHRARIITVPLVNLQLDAVALFEQIAVERRKFMHQIGKALPKCHGFYGRMLG